MSEEKRNQLEERWLTSLHENLEIILPEEEIRKILNEKYERWVYDKKRDLHNSQNRPMVEKRNRSDLVTIQDVIDIFNLYEYYRKEDYKGGKPLPFDDKRQIHHWENQLWTKSRLARPDKKSPSERTILIEMPDGSIKNSPCYNNFRRSCVSADQEIQNKQLCAEKQKEINTGHKLRNEIEAIAISLLIKLINEYNHNYIFSTVFDGLKADLMIRNIQWTPNQWVAIQIKSANINFGRQTRYTIKAGEYENIYCICIGLLYYDENIEPDSCDDTKNTAKIFEILDMGEARAIYTIPGLKSYKPINRLYLLHEKIEKKENERLAFVEDMLSNIEKFPRFTKEHILFDIEFNDMNATKNRITEIKGIEVIYKLLEKYGISLTAPHRQNEAVDYVIEYNQKRICVSQKTASTSNGITQGSSARLFRLSVAPNSRFVDIIIAICPKMYNKISLINSEIYSDESKRSFNWCERSAEKKGVREFDISTEKGEMDLIKALFPEYPSPN
jgi:hypothetical protein